MTLSTLPLSTWKERHKLRKVLTDKKPLRSWSALINAWCSDIYRWSISSRWCCSAVKECAWSSACCCTTVCLRRSCSMAISTAPWVPWKWNWRLNLICEVLVARWLQFAFASAAYRQLCRSFLSSCSRCIVAGLGPAPGPSAMLGVYWFGRLEHQGPCPSSLVIE